MPSSLDAVLRQFHSVVGFQPTKTVWKPMDLTQQQFGPLLLEQLALLPDAPNCAAITPPLQFALERGMHPSVIAVLLEKAGPQPLAEALQNLNNVRWCSTHTVNDIGKRIELAARLHPSPTTKTSLKIAKLFKKSYKSICRLPVDDPKSYVEQRQSLTQEFVLQSTLLAQAHTTAHTYKRQRKSKM